MLLASILANVPCFLRFYWGLAYERRPYDHCNHSVDGRH
jgi:hypothetical protein